MAVPRCRGVSRRDGEENGPEGLVHDRARRPDHQSRPSLAIARFVHRDRSASSAGREVQPVWGQAEGDHPHGRRPRSGCRYGCHGA